MNNFRSIRRALLVFASTCLLATTGAIAQPKVTRLVVAFPPGGSVDFVARAVSEQLGKELGQTVIIENRAGANGAIAAEYVSRATPDGTTLWLSSVGAVAVNPSLYEKLAYDPVRDLAPISMVTRIAEALVVPTNAPWSTGAEFIAAARTAKSAPTMASTGTGSVPHLAMELLVDATKTALTHVPYRGAAPATTDVIAGHVDGFFADIPGLMPFIKAGKVKPIGVAAERRHPLLPDVKTFDEMGIKGVYADNWYALFTGRAVPTTEIERVNQAMKRTLANEDVRAKLLASGAVPEYSTPAALATLLKQDSEKWSRIIKAKKITAD